ncbi:hypothetical protein GY21_16815 [Cryobacterium roopkundense]|uniref:Uncharacterized protein n=1 Tax=Cryobacterium roopkundense TaxID=1001240 RepID=A0A099J1C5_9MICO|nr:protealysin inhibitor emfourin [Cryobacterium roopkundense]KGJ72219.1 hypothetical protein GY21_16815 [Cryobacterium roopkundense]MBB5642840.1 hypothetical protein [Cryobacterium roopkundense]
MRLSVRRGGGFAGIVARTDLDADTLSQADAAALAAEVDRAGLRSLTDPPGGRTWPDSLLYDISLTDDSLEFHYHCSEESLPEGVRTLLAWVDARPERVESIEP